VRVAKLRFASLDCPPRAAGGALSAHERAERRENMLNLYSLAILLVRRLAAYVRGIARHDPDLARQMRRALTSVPLNIAEGMDARGRNRIARYDTALGSQNEVIACLDVGEALEYIAVAPEDRDLAQRVRATLLRLIKPRR
jgi:four helix bundle protein